MSRLELMKSFVLVLASTSLLFLLGVAIPFVGVLLVPLVPQPALAFGLRHGKANGVGLLAVGTLLLWFFGGKVLGLGFGFLALMVILLYGALDRGWSIEAVVAGPAIGLLAAVSGILLFHFGSLAQIRAAIGAALKENLELSLRVYEQIGFSPQGMEVLRERAPQVTELVLQILPAFAFVAFAVILLVNLFFLQRRFPDRELFVAAGNLREWKSPESLVWCFIVAGFALFLPAWQTLKGVALNLFLVIAAFYFFQGLAIVAYYFHRKNVPFFLRSLAYVLIVFEQLLTLLVVGLGLFDLWGDFRRLKKKNLNPSRAS